MISLDKTLEDMKKEIGYGGKKESFIYSQNENPNVFSTNYGFTLPGFNLYNSFADKLISKFSHERDTTVDTVQDAFYNAVERGNENDPDLPFLVEVYYGDKGRILSVEDCGDGFDPREVKIKKDAGVKYYQYGGRGFKKYDECSEIVSWNDKGNIIYIMSKEK